MSEQEDFDAQWNVRARAHNSPPATPRDDMWAAIQAARGLPAAKPEADVIALPARTPRRTRPAVWWVTGIAAATVLGAVLGRVPAPGSNTDSLTARGGMRPETTAVASAPRASFIG